MSNWRLAVRVFAKSPGFGLAIVLTLALGIGASTAAFSIVDGVLVRPLPYRDAGQLVRLIEGYEGAAPLRTGARLGSVTYHAWKDAGLGTVTAIEGYSESGDALIETGGGRALTRVALVSPGLFGMLGVSPIVGRLFAAGDTRAGAEPVIVLSEGLWRERFGADPGAVGRTVGVAGQEHRVIGVAARGFAFPDARTRLWLILDIPRPIGRSANPPFSTFFALARLRPASTPAQVAAEGTAIARTINPKPLAARGTFGEGGAAFVGAMPMLDEMTSGVKAALVVIATGIACILVIACVNVSNLLLSRGAARQRELAVRTALGANWSNLARQLLAESLVLSIAGGRLGVLLAFWTIRALPFLAPADFPRLENVQLDPRVLSAALSMSLLTGVIYRILRPTDPFFNYQIVARTKDDPGAVVSALRDVVREIAPDATVNAVPLSQRSSASIAQPRFATVIFVALAAVASSLTAIGLFAALAYSLVQRRREFGVRVAVGATRAHLVKLAVREGITPAAIGIIVGLGAAFGTTRFMQAILFGVSSLDTASFVVGPLLLVPVALTACLLPALRASRVDPVVTLRTD